MPEVRQVSFREDSATGRAIASGAGKDDFKSVERSVAKEPGVKDPAAVAAAIGRKKLGNAEMARRSAAGRAKDAEYKESELLRMPLQELLKLHKKIFGSAPPGNFSAAGIAAEIVHYTKSYVPAKDAALRYKPTDCIYNPPS